MLTKLKEEEDEIVGTVPILLCSPQNMTAKMMILRKFEKVYVDKTKRDEIVGTLPILLSSPQNMTAKMVF